MFLKGNVFLFVMIVTTGVVLAEFHCTPGREFVIAVAVVVYFFVVVIF
jgi:hypothetical protein